jgi:SAM-dependent methyltransferase
MSVFEHYARYYDLLYKDKDYAGETEYVHSLLQRFANKPKSILELGCGTGKHAMLLAEKGYLVTGVDQSEDMLAKARKRIAASKTTIDLRAGDVRNVRLNKQFDAVISLFHVMSYQTTNEDLLDAFATARNHLKSGGIFIFDCWYGPTVLTDRPVVRVKKLEDEAIQVTRIAEPKLHPNENMVDVNYTVFIKEKRSGTTEEIHETHEMRYLFKPEIKFFLEASDFDLLHCEEWLTAKNPGFGTWGVVFTGRLK